MMSVGFDDLNTSGANGVIVEMLDTAQSIALDQITSYELRNNIEITGQTP